jgi:hypothetical protein
VSSLWPARPAAHSRAPAVADEDGTRIGGFYMNTNPTIPPLEPLLILDLPTSQQLESEKPSKTGIAAVPAVVMISNEEAAIRTSLRSIDTEETLRSCAHLLDFASLGGSKEVDGPLAFGIARALQFCADRIGEERER